MRALLRIACVIGVVLMWSAAAHAATFTVTTIDDGDHGSCGATCTLRDAITAANASVGADTVTFAADGSFSTDAALPVITGPVTIDGTTAPSYAGTPTVTLLPYGGSPAGLVLAATGITVKALKVITTGFFGIYIGKPGGDVVQGSIVGPLGGYPKFGIGIIDSSGNRIGGSGAGEGNTFEDTDFGLFIAGTSTGNNVEGNLVHHVGEGIWVQSPGNVIGGTAPGAGNTVAGNAYHGIVVVGPAPGNVIEGNLVGSLDGTAGTRNGLSGIVVASPNTIVGGTTPGARNVISGNAVDAYANGAGILVLASGNTIQGNYIGTDASGTSDAGNFHDGIRDFAGGNTIGGAAPGAGNLISGNDEAGVSIWAPGDTIQGNYVGLDASGTTAVANLHGILVNVKASSTTIGGTVAGAGNVISGNSGVGIAVTAVKVDKTVIRGNLIGTTADGLATLPNALGVQVMGRSYLVGGTTPEARNIVSGNNGTGITASGSKGVIAGNYVGTDVTGTTTLPNTGHGIVVASKAITIGGTAAGAGNVISGNGGSGIYLPAYAPKAKNLIAGNRIGTTADGTGALGNLEDGITIAGGSGNTIGGTTPEAANVISGNGQYGVDVVYAKSAKNLVEGNRIGTDATGTAAIGNLEGGIILGAAGMTVGGTKPGAGNVISGNGGSGISVVWAGNMVYGNLIGTQADGASPLGNAQYGVLVNEPFGAATGPVGGLKPGMSNVIGYNGQGGADVILGTASGIFGNSFFANGTLGIDLGGDGPTPNDPFDSDTGPDGLQNFPVLNPTTIVNGNLIISGTLSGAPGSYAVYLYSNFPSDAAPQARTLIGLVKMKVGGSGDGTFSYSSLPLPAGATITAVATDSSGAASEISAAVTA